MGKVLVGRDVNKAERECVGLQRASTRAWNTRGNNFLPSREITARSA